MKWFVPLLLLLLSLLGPSAQAGWPLVKKARPDQAKRVPELLKIVQTDQDERRRAEAVAELRDYDMLAHPQIVPVLIDVLGNDKTPWRVRLEAATALGKQRPLPPEIGQALERAANTDASLRVRWQAKSALFWGGRGSRPAEPSNLEGPPVTTSNPSLAGPRRSLLAPSPPGPGVRPGPQVNVGQPRPKPWPPRVQTGEPPLASWPNSQPSELKPLPLPPGHPAPLPNWSGTTVSQQPQLAPVPLRPVPTGPSRLMPTPHPQSTPPTRPTAEDEGPILGPPPN